MNQCKIGHIRIRGYDIGLQPVSLPRRQQGAVLIISLMFLLIMTLIGVTAMQSTTMEEKMAGNVRDHNLAFQAAEAALRDAETYIETVVSTAAFDDTNGRFSATSTSLPDASASATWASDNTSRAYSGTIGGVNTQPRYFIQHIADISGGASTLNVGGYGAATSGGDTSLFRITARGTGGSDNSQVVLRSHYGRRF